MAGTAIRYRAVGAGAGGAAILMIHGAGGSSRQFVPVLNQLPARRAIAIDLPGHGESDGHVPSSLNAVSGLLVGLMDKLGLGQAAVVVAHSMGGLAALRLALAYPDRVDSLVLIGTAPRLRVHPRFIDQAHSGAWDVAWLRGAFADDVSAATMEMIYDDLLRMRVGDATRTFRELSAVDLGPELQNITCPALILTGGDDVVVSPRHSDRLARALPCARLIVIPRAGHYLHLEQAALIAQYLSEWRGSERPRERTAI